MNVAKDVENYLLCINKKRRSNRGTTVLRGYKDALELVVELYIAKEAYDPLVSFLRNWNWEAGDDKLLRSVTNSLLERKDWVRIQKLWEVVAAKRKKLYKQMKRIKSEDAKAISSEQLKRCRRLLLDSLNRLHSMALTCRAEKSAVEYAALIDQIKTNDEVNN